MKFNSISCIVVAAAAFAKVSADCFSTSLGYPCCSSGNTNVYYTDESGQWGVENNNWCGISTKSSSASSDTCTGQSQGYSCCNTCNVVYTDSDGNWGVENGQWCGIKSSCNSGSSTTTTTKKATTTTIASTTTSTAASKATSSSNIPLNPPSSKTTRYWDCCVASCSWSENTNASHPVNVCNKDGVTLYSPFDWTIGNVCVGGKGYMCNDNQPWAINDNISYGFVAAGFSNGSQKEWCCTCQRLQFTSGPIAGKQMVVQITNTGGDLSNNHFDIQMPGGGVGIFNGCQSQWNTGNDGWGERYGGVSSASDCSSLPTELQAGCNWRFNWFQNADNPSVIFERVQCPKELTDITGCIPVDDASANPLPW